MAKDTTAWWIAEDGSGGRVTHFRNDIADQELGSGLVRVRVEFSALNYKDALALTGRPGVIRRTPLIPGIDAAGVVEHSDDPRFAPGAGVVVTGFGYGEDRHGGLATTMLADPEHLIAIPAGLTTRQAATLGTAGITALLAVHALSNHGITPQGQNHPIAVTGAAGAVGSFALFFLAHKGFAVTAVTGRTDESAYLRLLGATDITSRQEVLSLPHKPLLPETYDGVVDQAGGQLLATLIASTARGGAVTACGLAGGTDLPTSVMPFILRGITLVGVNSVYQDLAIREALWGEFAEIGHLIPWDEISHLITLEAAEKQSRRVLAGATRGRVVIEVPR